MSSCATSPPSPDVIIIDALIALPCRKELQVDSPRTRCVKKFAEELLAILRKDADSELQARFQEFARELYTALNSIIASQPSTMLKLREKMWTQYACLRANTLPPLWKCFLAAINCEAYCSEPLLMELVNESIVEYLIKATFPLFETTRLRATPTIEMSMNEDEENILRYACGYI